MNSPYTPHARMHSHVCMYSIVAGIFILFIVSPNDMILLYTLAARPKFLNLSRVVAQSIAFNIIFAKSNIQFVYFILSTLYIHIINIRIYLNMYSTPNTKCAHMSIYMVHCSFMYYGDFR